MINIDLEIEKLISYGIKNGLLENSDINYTRNRLLDILNLNDINETQSSLDLDTLNLDDILNNILKWALDNKLIENDSVVYKDLFDTKVMGVLLGRPSEIVNKFKNLYNKSPKEATNYFYDFSKKSNYIRWSRVKKDLKWKTSTEFGDFDITINLSKPEKDPKAIAKAKDIQSSSYPKCLLCKENEGFRGRINHPARQNLRLIPLELNNEKWFFQYSPYVYYNEHCIVFKSEHEPMKISKDTFIRLLDFVEQFPHYFLGSNADLPIVGGSILTHDHFQGGSYDFAMAKAPIEKYYDIKDYVNVKVGRVKWPMSVIRIQSLDKNELIDISYDILCKWRNYSDKELDILAYTDEIPHNTITPIARRRGELYEVDLVLRNNRTNSKYPNGIFHPHKELHHIKKENIGLIEVMGLAVLPARLKKELNDLSLYLTKDLDILTLKDDSDLVKHKEWILQILNKYSDINKDNVNDIIKIEVGLKFEEVLENAGVYKRNEVGLKGFDKFINSL